MNAHLLRHLENIRKSKLILTFEEGGSGTLSAAAWQVKLMWFGVVRDNTIPFRLVQHAKVEDHTEFLMEYFASFGTTLVPNLGVHKKVLVTLCKRYQIVASGRAAKELYRVANSKSTVEATTW